MIYSTALNRRCVLRAGTIGLLGVSLDQLSALRAMPTSSIAAQPRAKSVIYIFLSGGLAQHDSFDMKPEAPANIRGEFQPIATRTPGIHICEHLPKLAQRSDQWALVRSLTHPYNEHNQGHMVMLSGRTPLPPNFSSAGRPGPNDWPSMASTVGVATAARNGLPPAVLLPEALNKAGELAGAMGPSRAPWVVEASPKRNKSWGAFPTYAFDHHDEKAVKDESVFRAPTLSLPEGVGARRFRGRTDFLREIEQQQRELVHPEKNASFDRFREGAISLLGDEKVKWAFDVTNADARDHERYGRHSFGWSLLMARRLVEVGVNLVHVNLGNEITWDTHGSNFMKLRDFLLPPMDQALSALLDDLNENGLLDSTLIVMAGEFGRSPKIFQCCPTVYERPGRDHWGAAQTVLFAGGGVRGGNVVGSTDKDGGWPSSAPQTPENMAATIYDALGIPHHRTWEDSVGRPHHIYHAAPITGLV